MAREKERQHFVLWFYLNTFSKDEESAHFIQEP